MRMMEDTSVARTPIASRSHEKPTTSDTVPVGADLAPIFDLVSAISPIPPPWRCSRQTRHRASETPP